MKNRLKKYGILAALTVGLAAMPSLAKAASSYNVDISISFGPTASVIMKHAHHSSHPMLGPNHGDPRVTRELKKDPKFDPRKPMPQPKPLPPMTPKGKDKKKVEPLKSVKPEPQKTQPKQPESKQTAPKAPAPRR